MVVSSRHRVAVMDCGSGEAVDIASAVGGGSNQHRALCHHPGVFPTSVSELPRLSVRPNLDIERPCRTGLVCNVPGLIGNCSGRDEKLVGLVLEALAGPRNVNHGIDDNVGNMDTLRSQLPSHRLGEDALGRLRRGKARKIRPTPLR
jgi:hypothetical protein